MTEKKLDLTIIILSYNSQYWLKQTLTTLKKWVVDPSRYQLEVVVVDNGSQDGSVSVLKKDFKWVKLIENGENVGFAAGNNIALKDAHSRYVMLLNSDVESTSNSKLDELLEYLDDHPDVTVATPKLVLQDGQLDWASHRGEPTLWASATYFSGLAKLFPQVPFLAKYHLSDLDLTVIHEIDACSGAAMIVRTSAMKKVGLLDEAFFFYAEDLDWCRRFRTAGGKVIFYPHVQMTHHKYKSGLSSQSDQTKRKTRAYFYDTMLQYYDKHYRQLYPEWVRVLVKQVINLKKGGL